MLAETENYLGGLWRPKRAGLIDAGGRVCDNPSGQFHRRHRDAADDQKPINQVSAPASSS